MRKMRKLWPAAMLNCWLNVIACINAVRMFPFRITNIEKGDGAQPIFWLPSGSACNNKHIITATIRSGFKGRTVTFTISIYLTPIPDFGMLGEHCGSSRFCEALNHKG
jgi:hypothetical protein